MKEQKQLNDFVVSVAGPNIDMTIVNIEEMSLYCKSRNRLASVVTHKQTYDELDKLNYSLIMNYTKPKPRVVNTKDKQFHDVYRVLSEKYKGGLLVVEGDTLSEAVSDILCGSNNWQDNDVDIMICREGLGTVTPDELKKANYLRISADPDLDPSVFIKFQDFLEARTMAIMICQFFANDQFDSVKAYMAKANDYYSGKGMTDYVDYYELNRQLAYFVYFDMQEGKIINVARDKIKAFVRKMMNSGILPIPEAQADDYVEMITV